MIQVWLPDTPERMGGLPAGMSAEVWTGTDPLPAGEPEVIVLPFGISDEKLAKVLSLPSLRLLQLMSAGAERVAHLARPAVTICNARGAHDIAVAEWTIGVIIAHIRLFPRYVEAQRERRWDTGFGESLSGKRVLIVGYGSIGEAVERRLDGFGVDIERVARHERDGVAAIGQLPQLLPDADIVILLVPVTPQTRGLADAKFLAAMKDGALLVNAARGAIVDTDALVSELNSGRLRAALDVTDPEPLPAGHPLWSAPGLLLTPHVAGNVHEARDRAYAIIRDQLARYADGRPLRNIVNVKGY